MNILSLISNLGVSDPLTLSMAHPVKRRINQMRRKPLRFGALLVAIIGAPMLFATSAHTEDKPYDFKPQELSLRAYWIGDGTELGLADAKKRFIIDYTAERELRIASTDPDFDLTTPRGDETFPNLFAPAVKVCSGHAQKSLAPIFYKTDIPARIDGVHAGQYLIRCFPGTRDQRRALTPDAVKAALNDAADFSTAEKAVLAESLSLN